MPGARIVREQNGEHFIQPRLKSQAIGIARRLLALV